MLETNDTGVPSSPISGLYDSYEKNANYILKFRDAYYICNRIGAYELMAISHSPGNIIQYVTVNISSDDTFIVNNTYSYDLINFNQNPSLDSIYRATAINSMIPTYQTITVGNFSASSTLGSLYVWRGHTTDSVPLNVMYFPTGLNTIQAVGTFIYGFKRANENTITLITTTSMPALAQNISLEVFKVVVMKNE